MQPIIYDVAVSADGFIAGPSGDVSHFPNSGPIVDDYMARLAQYSCAIMGRKTYEFAYQFGMEPGANPYPHMRTMVFSKSIDLPEDAKVQVIGSRELEEIDGIRSKADGPVYLCGGGQFAGWLLQHGRIDLLRIKRAPIFLGSGVRLFGDHGEHVAAKLRETILHEDGILFQEFELG